MRRLAQCSVLVWGFIAAWPALAASQACEPGPVSPASQLFDLPIPGGAAAIARAAGLPEPVSLARFVPALVQWRHQGSAGDPTPAELDASLAAIARLLRTLGPERALVASPDAGARGTVPEAALAALGFAWQPTDRGPELVEAGGTSEAHGRQLLQTLGILPGDLFARLQSGEVVSVDLTVDCGPVPLSLDAWQDDILREEVAPLDLFGRLLADPRAGLTYIGLLEVDAGTRAWLATRRDLLARLYDDHAAAFAAFGRSLSVQNGRVRVPGGEAAGPIWEALAGAPPDDAERFVLQVLARDEGALAAFYDLVADLDEHRLAYVLGGPELGERARIARVRGAYAAGLASGLEWSPASPFARPDTDPFAALGLIGVSAGGKVAAPLTAEVFARAFDVSVRGSSLPPALLLRGFGQGATPGQRLDRLRGALFVQRAFGAGAEVDAAVLARVLEGFTRVPALLLTLERAGIRDASLHARAIDVALALTRDTRPETAVAVSMMQGAVAVVERLRRVGAVSLEETSRLFATLLDACDAQAADPDSAGSPVARWLAVELLPTVVAPLAARDGDGRTGDAEDAMLVALSGVPAPGRAGHFVSADRRSAVISWEGEQFFADPAGSELVRLRAVRLRQRPLTVTEWQATVGLIRASDGEAPELSSALEDAWVPGITVRPVAEAYVERIRRGLEQHGSAPAARRAAVDLLTARMLTSLVYALAIGDPDGRALMAGAVADRHNLDLVRVGSDVDVRRAWAIPQGLSGAGTLWHVRGSLLALDVGLAELALRRMDPAQPDLPPRLTSPQRAAFAEGVALMSPRRLTADDGAAIAGAIAEGLRRLENPAPGSGPSGDLLPGWRGQVAPWARARDAGGLTLLFTLADIFWMGMEDGTYRLADLDAWGAPQVRVSGALETRMPSRADLGKRIAEPRLAARAADLTLSIAVHLHEHGLPASLAPGILARAVYDLTERAQPIHPADALAVTAYVRALPAALFADYVAALAAAGGPLVPVESLALSAGRPARDRGQQAPVPAEGRQP